MKEQQSYKDEIKKNNEKQCGITKGATKEQQKKQQSNNKDGLMSDSPELYRTSKPICGGDGWG